ncbi:hypothetical protein PMIN06_011512 [Paraphaeosphaeria minitans]
MANYEMVKFLLKQGALVDEESYNHVWDFSARMKCSHKESTELACITSNPPSLDHEEWEEAQRFPLAHRIVTLRDAMLLQDELEDNPNTVAEKDASGRTALDWAAALGRVPEMRLLLDYGAQVNTMDNSGRSAVLHAVDSSNAAALRTLLDSGAFPDPEVPRGLFRSSPLNAATFGGKLDMVELLIQSGAAVCAVNPEGRSPVATAIRYNKHDELKYLIRECKPFELRGIQNLYSSRTTADMTTTTTILAAALSNDH